MHKHVHIQNISTETAAVPGANPHQRLQMGIDKTSSALPLEGEESTGGSETRVDVAGNGKIEKDKGEGTKGGENSRVSRSTAALQTPKAPQPDEGKSCSLSPSLSLCLCLSD